MGNICDRFFQLKRRRVQISVCSDERPELGIYCSGQLSHIGVMAGYVDQRICILFCFFNKSGFDFSLLIF